MAMDWRVVAFAITWIVWGPAEGLLGIDDVPDHRRPAEQDAPSTGELPVDEDDVRTTGEIVLAILKRQHADRLAELAALMEKNAAEQKANRGRNYSAEHANTLRTTKRILEAQRDRLANGPPLLPITLDPFALKIDTVGHLSRRTYEVYRVVGPREVMVRCREQRPAGYDRRYTVPRLKTKEESSPPFLVQGIPTRGLADRHELDLGGEDQLFHVAATRTYRAGLGKTSTALVLVYVPRDMTAPHWPPEPARRPPSDHADSGRRRGQ